MVQLGRPPNRIDLLSRLGTVSFQRAWARRQREVVRLRAHSIPLPIIGLRDLIQSKRDAGRHRDLDDVEHLLALRRPDPARAPRVRRRVQR